MATSFQGWLNSWGASWGATQTGGAGGGFWVGRKKKQRDLRIWVDQYLDPPEETKPKQQTEVKKAQTVSPAKPIKRDDEAFALLKKKLDLDLQIIELRSKIERKLEADKAAKELIEFQIEDDAALIMMFLEDEAMHLAIELI